MTNAQSARDWSSKAGALAQEAPDILNVNVAQRLGQQRTRPSGVALRRRLLASAPAMFITSKRALGLHLLYKRHGTTTLFAASQAFLVPVISFAKSARKARRGSDQRHVRKHRLPDPARVPPSAINKGAARRFSAVPVERKRLRARRLVARSCCGIDRCSILAIEAQTVNWAVAFLMERGVNSPSGADIDLRVRLCWDCNGSAGWLRTSSMSRDWPLRLKITWRRSSEVQRVNAQSTSTRS